MSGLPDCLKMLEEAKIKLEIELEKVNRSIEIFKASSLVKKYTSMSQKEAIIAYLKEVEGYCTIKEITNALVEGGLETKADKLYSNINTILIRDNTLFKKENKRWSLI
jgi:hypothetical protein